MKRYALTSRLIASKAEPEGLCKDWGKPSMWAQILATAIFVGMFLMIIFDRFEHYMITLVSGALVLILVFGVCMQSFTAVSTTLNIHSIFAPGFWYGESEGGVSGINWATIIFIAGMMIMVEGLGLSLIHIFRLHQCNCGRQ